MSLAAIFAILLASGACAENRFQAPDGTVLSVLVCPHLAQPGGEDAPDAPAPKPPGKPT